MEAVAVYFPAIFQQAVALRLPLQIGQRVGAIAFKRQYVVDDIAWTRTASPAVNRAGI